MLRPRRHRLYNLLICLAILFMPLVSLGWAALQTTFNIGTGVSTLALFKITYDCSSGSGSNLYDYAMPGDNYSILNHTCGNKLVGGVESNYYNQVGWSLIDGGSAVTSLNLVDNTVLYPVWELVTLTLTYDNNGGSGCTNTTTTYGSPWGTLCVPTKPGNAFIGWFTESSGGTEVTSATVPTDDQTVYAHWQEAFTCTGCGATITPVDANTYEITFINSGSLSFNGNFIADIFLVGGGGGGAGGQSYSPYVAFGGGGGGGGRVKTYTSKTLLSSETYAVTIGGGGSGGATEAAGGSGGTTSITGYDANYTAAGGSGGGKCSNGAGTGGSGGSGGGGGGQVYDGGTNYNGGAGGSNGASGSAGSVSGGSGLDSSTGTRKFGSTDTSLRAYAAGGGGGGNNKGSGGSYGGGNGGGYSDGTGKAGKSATANTGSGGGGGYSSNSGGSGGSGIIIVKIRATANQYTVTYNNNGGSGCTSKTIIQGSLYGTLCTPTKSGYRFIGWYSNQVQDTSVTGTQVTASTRVNSSNHTLYAGWIPEFTYTGNSTVVFNNSSDYKIRFLSSGTYTPTQDITTDIFIVGGGGSGAGGYKYSGSVQYGGGGGGGGRVKTVTKKTFIANTGYSITIGGGGAAGANDSNGSAGGASSVNVTGLTYTANGGSGGSGWQQNSAAGGSGGSGGGAGGLYYEGSTNYEGGAGGSNGASGGASGTRTGGTGNDSSTGTREFGSTDTSVTAYAAGGGGAGGNASSTTAGGGAGGTTGGGKGGTRASNNGTAATANTGSGGGGGLGAGTGGAGGSGIAIIRNITPAGRYTLTYDNNGGSGCTTKPIIEGNTLGTLCTPTRSGYTFRGWYSSSTGGIEITATTIATGDRTVYAAWTVNFTYTGTYEVVFDSSTSFRIKLKTGGTFTPSATVTADIFLVGGGGGGGGSWAYSGSVGYGGGGGGGGRVGTYTNNQFTGGSGYTVTIGAGGSGGAAEKNGSNGGTTSITGDNISYSVAGGTGGKTRANSNSGAGGNGGSGGGGAGYSNGSTRYGGGNGGTNGSSGGAGQYGSGTGLDSATGTREFGSTDTSVTAYAAGGGGGGYTAGTGGNYGGGNGGSYGNDYKNGKNGIANTGSGGGGAFVAGSSAATGGTGGTGIVIIRIYN